MHGAPANFIGPTLLGYVHGINRRDQSDSNVATVDTYSHSIDGERLADIRAHIPASQSYVRVNIPLAPDSVVLEGMIVAYDLHTDAVLRDSPNPAMVANLAHTDFIVDRHFDAADLADGFSPWEAGGLLPDAVGHLEEASGGRSIYKCLQDPEFSKDNAYVPVTRFAFAGLSISRSTVPGSIVKSFRAGGPTDGKLTTTLAGLHQVNTFNSEFIPAGTTVYLDTPTAEECEHIHAQLQSSLLGRNKFIPFALRTRRQLMTIRPWIEKLGYDVDTEVYSDAAAEFMDKRKVGCIKMRAAPYGKTTLLIKG